MGIRFTTALLSTALGACSAMAFAADPAQPRPGIGYPDVGAALGALRANPEARELQHPDGWTWYFVQESDERLAIWTFAPFRDPAYPAAIKRVLMMRDGALVMETRTMCQANLAACDAFLAATEADSKEFAARFAEHLLANAARVEREEAEQRRYHEHLRERARTLYGRP